MDWQDLLGLDNDSRVEVVPRPLAAGEEDVPALHGQVTYSGGEYDSILPSAPSIDPQVERAVIPLPSSSMRNLLWRGASKLELAKSSGVPIDIDDVEATPDVSLKTAPASKFHSTELDEGSSTNPLIFDVTLELDTDLGDSPHSPQWGVLNRELVTDPIVSMKMISHFATHAQRLRDHQLTNSDLIDQIYEIESEHAVLEREKVALSDEKKNFKQDEHRMKESMGRLLTTNQELRHSLSVTIIGLGELMTEERRPDKGNRGVSRWCTAAGVKQIRAGNSTSTKVQLLRHRVLCLHCYHYDTVNGIVKDFVLREVTKGDDVQHDSDELGVCRTP
ncbi:hypothetical protein L1987_57586 [Smallanthus sonchifolius]|uniref:Uncharacterized protein n=1 Tax=Smallanthus sonchifolius TaxID=185202 RepID=A0ACB9DCY6_9ASTR|nr:hypothetical protein L1987_57586 [Smallanthus sonchifolius]